MCNVNYVAEFEAFMRYAEDNLLSGRERLLWIALFHSANRRKTWNAQTGEYEWPEGFFVVTNDALHSNACLDKRGVADMRNSLKQRGLIDFIKGEKNKAHPQYKINYFTVRRENVPNNVPNHVPNDTPNHAPNSTPTIPPTAPQYININTDTGGNTGIRPLGNQEKIFEDNNEQEYYSNAHTREFLSAADSRYLNQYRTRDVLAYKDELALPNDNWLTSERARMATAQHVVNAIIEHSKCWGRDARETGDLYDLILSILNERRISPLSIYIMALKNYSKENFRAELFALNCGYYEYRAAE